MSAPATPPPSSGKKTWIIVGLGAFGCLTIVVLLLAAGGFYWWTHRPPTVERIYQAKEQPQTTPQPVAPARTGPDFSTPRGTAEALMLAWNSADYDGLLRLSSGTLHEKVENNRADAPRQFGKMKIQAIGEVSPVTTNAGQETCIVLITTLSEGKEDTDRVQMVKVGAEWLVTAL